MIEIFNLLIHTGRMGRSRLKKKQPKPSPARPRASSYRPPTHVTRSTQGAREILLHAARHLFARKGLSGTSIRDIAQAAKMNSSQISYYFNGKEGLYCACIADIAQGRTTTAEQILVLPTSAEEYRVRLRLFAENLIGYFLEDRDTGLIIIREYDRMHSPAEKIFRTYFARLFELLIDFFAHAIQSGYALQSRGSGSAAVAARQNLDPLILTSLYFGMLMSELRLDHMKNGLFRRTLRDSDERAKVIQQIVNFLA